MRQILGDFQRNTTDAGHKAYIERQLTRWNQIPEVEDAPAHKQLPGQTADQATSTAVDGAEGEADDIFNIVLEPQLSAEQVLEVEDKIKDGLIEDVVESGWNELECAKAMMEARVWEPLEEVPVKGQWEGFERTPKGVGAQD